MFYVILIKRKKTNFFNASLIPKYSPLIMKNIKITSQKTTEKIQIIKTLSVFMMIAALILQLVNINTILNHQQIPSVMVVIIKVAKLALVIHLLEGILAFFYALAHRKNALILGIYTFFTGTITLLELFELHSEKA